MERLKSRRLIGQHKEGFYPINCTEGSVALGSGGAMECRARHVVLGPAENVLERTWWEAKRSLGALGIPLVPGALGRRWLRPQLSQGINP